jgi:serine/threonine protein phosphatase PrpC
LHRGVRPVTLGFSMKLRSAAHTDIGKVRLQNQDQFLCQPVLGLFGVADGVGGLPGGAEAAECAVRTLAHAVKNTNGDEPDLRAAMETANTAVVRLGELVSPETGIGTTATIGLFRGRKVRLAHVGDSRAYRLRDGKFQSMTEDHTVETEARRKHTPGEYMLLNAQSRHTLTRCVGQPVPLETDTAEHAATAGERWLFVTDGITRLVPDAELAGLLARENTPMDAVRTITTMAVERGGYDNATAVAVFVDAVGE